MKIIYKYMTFTVILLINCTLSFSQILKNVSTNEELILAITTASVGDTIIVADGSYDLGKRLTLTLNGEKEKPIVIKASNTGKSEFIGASGFVFKLSAYVVVEGFVFSSSEGPAIKTEGSNNIRITKNTFRLRETTPSIWILISGDINTPEAVSRHNRIDHNLFEQKSQLGNFIAIEGNKKPVPAVSQYDRIDHNHFRDIGPRAENVLEAIRVGSSEFSLSSGHTILEYNLFERCDGDPEVVSIKSSDNIIRYNTFRECLGVLSLRHGNRNTIDGNYFFGNGRSGTFTDSTGKTWTLGTGGVRFCGDSMLIVNNYFEGLTGKEWDAPLCVTNGDADYGMGLPLTKHYRTRFAVIAFNTFVNNDYNIEVGYDGGGFQGNWWTMPPSDLIIANNIVAGSTNTLIKIITTPINTEWMGNIVYNTGSADIGYQSGKNEIRVIDPKFEKIDGVFKLPKSSPAINTAVGSFPQVVFDVEGQKRENKKDIGADEFSDNTPTNKPLNAEDVGPYAKR